MRCPSCGHAIDDRALSRHLAAKGGAARTPAKRRAARINGLMGGRPARREVTGRA